jgi:SAM-dependent methyltransferase
MVIDWEAEWRLGQRLRPPSGATAWSARAPSFARQAAEPGYAEQVLDLLAPEPSWTVLDVGCGAGTLALPLARRTASVTGLDFSPVMIDLLRARCAEERVGNVTSILGSWEEDWEGLGVGPHDLVVASRSLAIEDLRGALVKVDRHARRAACVVAPVGDGPRDRRVFEAVGRPFTARPDYVVAVGLLHAMGIHADVTLIGQEEWRLHASEDEALRSMAWMLSEAMPEELDRLRAYLKLSLVPREGGWRLLAPRPVRWAVITWTKDGAAPPNTWRRVNGRPPPSAAGG